MVCALPIIKKRIRSAASRYRGTADTDDVACNRQMTYCNRRTCSPTRSAASRYLATADTEMT